MAKTSLDSLTKIATARLSLTDKANRLVEAEQRAIDEVRRLLSGIGYDLVPIAGKGTERRPAPAHRRTRVLPKTLKCPKCDRRFSLQMHVGRHMRATHGRGTRPAAKKKSAS